MVHSPSSPTSNVCSVCTITLLATDIALLIFFKHPTEPTSCELLKWKYINKYIFKK